MYTADRFPQLETGSYPHFVLVTFSGRRRIYNFNTSINSELKVSFLMFVYFFNFIRQFFRIFLISPSFIIHLSSLYLTPMLFINEHSLFSCWNSVHVALSCLQVILLAYFFQVSLYWAIFVLCLQWTHWNGRIQYWNCQKVSYLQKKNNNLILFINNLFYSFKVVAASSNWKIIVYISFFIYISKYKLGTPKIIYHWNSIFLHLYGLFQLKNIS